MDLKTKIINYKLKHLESLKSYRINLIKEIDTLSLHKVNDWKLINEFYEKLKKNKRKINNLSKNLNRYEVSSIKKIKNTRLKISNWYQSLPHIIHKPYIIFWSINFKSAKRIYERLKSKSYTYLHVYGYEGSSVFITPICTDLFAYFLANL